MLGESYNKQYENEVEKKSLQKYYHLVMKRSAEQGNKKTRDLSVGRIK